MKKNKKIIYVIIFLLLIVILFLQIHKTYFIGTITQIVEPTPNCFVVNVTESTAPYSGSYYIYSNKELHIGDKVKVTFILIPFHASTITLSNPQSLGNKNYYVQKINSAK